MGRDTMQHGQSGRWLLRLVLGIAVAAVLLLTWTAAVLEIRHGRVERAMARFRSAPNGEHTQTLIELLANRAVPREQGERILTLLLRPEVTTRPAYPAGRPAKMSVRRPLHIEMPQGRIVFEQYVWAAGERIDASRESTNRLFGFPQIFNAWLQPLEPGTYHAELRTECSIRHPPPRPSLWDRLYTQLRGRLLGRPVLRSRTNSEPSYECRFTVPFDVNLVTPDQAERLELVTDPQTDQTMRAAIGAETSEQHGVYATAAGRRGYRGSMSITFKRLPVATACELSLRLPDGRELPSGPGRQPQRIRLRAGDYGRFVVDVGSFGLEEPGEYAGTLVLKPDPDYAYEDPAIKAIWDNTLEFPISFSVYVRTRTQ